MSLTEQLKKIIGMEDELSTAPAKARIIAVAARKGGVGKTTTTVNLAVAMSRFFGLDVLVMDLDGQGHVYESLSKVIPDTTGASLSDILLSNGRDSRDLMDIVVPTDLERLYVTPSDKGLAATEGILAGRIGREFLLRNVIRKAAARFDVILFDCPPNVGNLTLNALTAATHVLIPCDMSVLSLAAVGDIIGVVDTVNEQLGHNLEVLGILPTRVDKRNGRLTEEVMKKLEHSWGSRVCRTRIPSNSALARAQMAGKSIFDFEPRAAGATAYKNLATETLNSMGFQITNRQQD